MMSSRRSVIVVLTAGWCVACFHRGALPIDSPWPQRVPAFAACGKVQVAGRPRTQVFDAFRRAARRERIPLFVVDSNDLRLVIAGPAAPAFRGSGALRRSRVYFELVTEPDSVAEGAGRFTLIEGASIVGRNATTRDSAATKVQASRLSRRLAQRAGYPTGGGCWSG